MTSASDRSLSLFRFVYLLLPSFYLAATRVRSIGRFMRRNSYRINQNCYVSIRLVLLWREFDVGDQHSVSRFAKSRLT